MNEWMNERMVLWRIKIKILDAVQYLQRPEEVFAEVFRRGTCQSS